MVKLHVKFASMFLALVFLVPLAPAEPLPAADWTLTDTLNDVVINGQTPPLANDAAHAHLDIAKVTIDGEDELGMYFTIILREFRVGTPTTGSMSSATYAVKWKHDQSSYFYSVFITVVGSASDADANSFFLAQSVPNDGTGICLGKAGDQCAYYRAGSATISDETNSIRVKVTKDELLAVGKTSGRGRPVDHPASLNKDDTFTGIHATAEGHTTQCQMFCPGDGSDIAGSSTAGTPYPLKVTMANTIVRLQIGQGDTLLPIVTGQEVPVVFTLHNNAEGKRIVALTFALTGPAAKQGGYAVTGPPSASAPGGSYRNYTFLVTTPAGAAFNDGVGVLISGVSVGVEGELARTTAVLRPTQPITVASNKLYLHAFPSAAGWGNQVCNEQANYCSYGQLSPVATVPGQAAHNRIAMRSGGQGQDGVRVDIRTDTGLAVPVALGPGRIDLPLTLYARSELPSVTITASLTARGGGRPSETLYETTRDGAVSMSGTEYDFGGNIRLTEVTVFPVGTEFSLFIRLRQTMIPAGEFVTQVTVDSKDASLRLPVQELPEEFRPMKVLSPFQLVMSPEQKGGDYVNPGKARLYNITILNQDPELQVASLSFSIDNPAWEVKILPAVKFNLKPGDTVTVGVLVRAPASAVEGEKAVVRFNVTALDLAFTLQKITTTCLVALGDLPDDSYAYVVDPEDQKKAESTAPAKAPGPGGALVGVLGGALVQAMRRRRGA